VDSGKGLLQQLKIDFSGHLVSTIWINQASDSLLQNKKYEEMIGPEHRKPEILRTK
jgi:hypothetical protein